MRVPYTSVASRLAVVSVVGATALGLTTAAMAQEAALLSWSRRDLNDTMTDRVTVRLASQANFPNGVTIDAWAKCTEIGMEFAFRAFNGDAPALLGWQDKKIQMRVRLGNEGVRIATIFHEYTNEAKAIFYDPEVTSRLVAKDLAGRRTGKQIDPMAKAVLGWLEDAAVQDGMAKLKQAAPGTIHELIKAESVRIELTLADGRANVVDLNPRDATLRSFVQGCAAKLGNGDRAATHGEVKVTCDGAAANNDATQGDEPVRQGTFPVDKQETGQKTGNVWYHITLDGKRFWIKQQACVTFVPRAGDVKLSSQDGGSDCLTQYTVYTDDSRVMWQGMVSVAMLADQFSRTKGELGEVEVISGPRQGGHGWVNMEDLQRRKRLASCGR